MEALATISLVENVLQFVQFETDVVHKALEVYKSGDLQEYDDGLVGDLDKLAVKLKAPGEIDDSLQRQVEECVKIGRDIRSALCKIRPRGSRKKDILRSVAAGVRAVWSKSDLEALLNTLTVARQGLILHLSVDQPVHLQQIGASQIALDTKLDGVAKQIYTNVITGQGTFDRTNDRVIEELQHIRRHQEKEQTERSVNIQANTLEDSSTC